MKLSTLVEHPLMLEFIRFQSPIGKLSILSVKNGVTKIAFANESIEDMKNWCRDHLGMETIEKTNIPTEAKCQIFNYLSGKIKSLDFPVVHINSPFRKKVLEAQRVIPYGQTSSYGMVAKMVGNPKASRAVGSSNACNPLPLYYPCHRIICSDGRLGGFGGGMEVKQYLLDLERQNS